MAYEWKDNPACVATYKVLEGDIFMDQFEDADVPFADAGALKVGSLAFCPQTTSNSQIIAGLAHQVAWKFLRHIVKTYTVKKENINDDSAEIIEALAAVFANKSATLSDLAAVADARIRFPNEV